MSLLASWRTALRIARREARQGKGRSALVVAMIALPVLALSFAAVTYDMITLTGGEKADRTMGTADARIEWPTHRPSMQMPDPTEGSLIGDGGTFVGDGGPVEVPVERGGPDAENPLDRPGTDAELREALAGATVLPVRRGTAVVSTPNGIGEPDAVMVDAGSAMTHGYVDVMEGRAPTAADEVALTGHAMDWLGTRIGGTISVRDGDLERPYTVVGRVEFPSLLDRVLLFPYQAEAPDWFSTQSDSWLVDTPEPITWDRVLELNKEGMLVTSRAVLLDPPPDEEVPLRQQWGSYGGVDGDTLAIGVLVSGLALLEVVLLAGPAFAVSARRRQRQLALVAANGGTPAHIRRIVLADGVVLGLLGAAAGIVVGIVGAFVGRPWVAELLTHERPGGYRVYPAALAAITGLAVVTGLLAALVPAFVTARQSVVAALAGRRGVTRSRKRWIAVGIVMIGVGAVITVAGTVRYAASIMLAGLVVAELGLVLCTPALVGLISRVGRLLPLAPRIALRNAARNRAAAAPAISAVMAAVAGSVALGMIMDSDRRHGEETWSQAVPTGTVTVYIGQSFIGGQMVSTDVAEAAMRSMLPVTDVHRVGSVTCPIGTASDKFCDLQILMNDLCPQLKQLRFGELTDDDRRAAGANPYCDPRDLAWGAGGVTVDDGSAIGTLTGATGDDLRRARETLAAGGAVVSTPLSITDGLVTFAAIMPDPDAPPEEQQRGQVFVDDDGIYVPPGYVKKLVTVPGYLVTTGSGQATVVSPEVARRAGFSTQDTQLVAMTTHMPSDAEMERFRAAMQALGTWGGVETGFPNEVRPELIILIVAAALIMLGAAGVGTGLAAADGRAELSTLAAVGASPTLRRGLSLSQSAVISGLGAVLGTLAGMGAAVAIIEAGNRLPWVALWPGTPTEPVLPRLTLLVVVVAVPLVSILGAGLLTRSRLPIERRL